MNCFFAKNHLSAYVEGTLANFHVDDLSAHLEGCVSCKRVYDELISVKRFLRDMPAVDVDKRLRLQLRTLLSQKKNRYSWSSYSLLPERLLLAVLSLSLIAGFFNVLHSLRLARAPVQPEIRNVEVVQPDATDPAASEAVALAHAAIFLRPEGAKIYGPALSSRPEAIVAASPNALAAASPSHAPDSSPMALAPASEVLASASPSAVPPSPPMYDVEISLTFVTSLIEEGQSKFQEQCKILGCRDLRGGKDFDFSGEGATHRQLAVCIPAKNYALLRSNLEKLGTLNEILNVTAKGQEQGAEGKVPEALSVHDLAGMGQTMVDLSVSIEEVR